MSNDKSDDFSAKLKKRNVKLSGPPHVSYANESDEDEGENLMHTETRPLISGFVHNNSQLNMNVNFTIVSSEMKCPINIFALLKTFFLFLSSQTIRL